MIKTIDTSPAPSILILDESPPPIEFAYVYRRPKTKRLRRGRLQDIDRAVIRAYTHWVEKDGAGFSAHFNRLTSEFLPALLWAESCKDFLNTTVGIRFLPRDSHERPFHRSEYRPFTERDYRRLIHSSFKQLMLAYGHRRPSSSFSTHVRRLLWRQISRNYRNLEHPSDPRQRTLTPYSYLRCTPYTFFNPYHQQRAEQALARLAPTNRIILEQYFFGFLSASQAGLAVNLSLQAFLSRRKQALGHLRKHDTLMHHLFLQIERY